MSKESLLILWTMRKELLEVDFFRRHFLDLLSTFTSSPCPPCELIRADNMGEISKKRMENDPIRDRLKISCILRVSLRGELRSRKAVKTRSPARNKRQGTRAGPEKSSESNFKFSSIRDGWSEVASVSTHFSGYAYHKQKCGIASQ